MKSQKNNSLFTLGNLEATETKKKIKLTYIYTYAHLLSRYNIYNNPDKYNFRFVWLLPAWVVNKWPNVGSKFQPISKYINNCIILEIEKLPFKEKIWFNSKEKNIYEKRKIYFFSATFYWTFKVTELW